MKKFKLWNTLCGWVVFAIAAATYLLTMEPTASFWDCGEFISSAAKLDVGHPPGAPFFMLMGHFFSLFASDTAHIAMCVNALSALASAFTILFLFWTITALAKKLVEPNTLWRGIGLLGAGAVGALAYTFSDTFWFSAVEGEVYASSSLFTAVVFWLMLKWDEHADEEGSDRWLIAIAYLMGLSIGVHLLNLLTIPAIGLVYYFRRYSFSWKGLISAFLASCAVLLVILYGIIPGFPTVAGWFELLFVNYLNCPFNTGLAVYIILVVASLVWAIVETHRDDNQVRVAISFTLAFALSGSAFLFEKWWVGLILCPALLATLLRTRKRIPSSVLNTIAVMITVILVGYSSYAAIVIRSNAQPPMDQNSPKNVFALKYYLNREQYGDRPLFYGQTFNAPIKLKPSADGYAGADWNYGEIQYAPAPHVDGKSDRYVEIGQKRNYKYQPEFCMLFPRMYSSQDNHIAAYKIWAGMPSMDDATNAKEAKEIAKAVKKRNKPIKEGYVGTQSRGQGMDLCPTFGDNLQFFFNYQVHFMYWRYFMWNFVGRQNDIQSHGDITKGQWISGISFIDNARLGDQSKLPKELRENKGHNVYYFLPLLLGIIGILWQISRKKDGKEEGWKNFTLTFLLFFLTGLAIVIYLNQTPLQPRERDYAYAGSFYAFCIWIGLGVLALIDWAAQGICLLMKKTNSEEENSSTKVMLASVAGLVTVVCLGIPALMAQQNWDDHDRSDRYVCRDFGANYLRSCEAGGILFTFGDNDTFPLWYNQEVEGVGDSLRVCNLSYLSADWYTAQMQRPYYQSEALPISWKFEEYQGDKCGYVQLATDPRRHPGYGQEMLVSEALQRVRNGEDYIPASFLYVWTPNHEKMYFNMGYSNGQPVPKKGYLYRADLLIMEMISTNNWERPIYFSSVSTSNVGIEGYLKQTGLAYQVVPYYTGVSVDTEKMYDNMMHKFKYGNVNKPGIYLDENTMRMCYIHRSAFFNLAHQLLADGQKEKAKEVLDRCEKELPGYNIPHTNGYSLYILIDYFQLGCTDSGMDIANQLAQNCAEYIDFAVALGDKLSQMDLKELGDKARTLRDLLVYGRTYLPNEFVAQYVNKLETYYKLIYGNGYVYNMATLYFDLNDIDNAMKYAAPYAQLCAETIERSTPNDAESLKGVTDKLIEVLKRAQQHQRKDLYEKYIGTLDPAYRKIYGEKAAYYLSVMYAEEFGSVSLSIKALDEYAQLCARDLNKLMQKDAKSVTQKDQAQIEEKLSLLDNLIGMYQKYDLDYLVADYMELFDAYYNLSAEW